MTGIILAILAAIFIGLSQLMLRKSFKELKPSVAFLFDAIFGLFLWVPLALIMGVNLGIGLKEAALFAIISAILSEAIVFYALSHGELAITATVLATYPAYTVILSWIINNEVISFNLLFFVVIAILGSIMASLPNDRDLRKIRLNKHIIWPFVAAVCIGLSDTISKGYINRSNDFSLLFMLGFVQVPVALTYLKLEKEGVAHALKSTLGKIKSYNHAIAGAFFNIIGTGLLWLSFSYAPASIASPITGVSGVFTVILARYFLSDKITTRQYLAIAMAFIGVVGIAVQLS